MTAPAGVEGTGSYGAGLARHLSAAGVAVVEVNDPTARCAAGGARPTPSTPRPRPGPRSTVPRCACPRAPTGPWRRSGGLCGAALAKARTQAANQINGSAPDTSTRSEPSALVEVCARWRPESSPDTVTAAAKTALR